jgi:hypothetical protein
VVRFLNVQSVTPPQREQTPKDGAQRSLWVSCGLKPAQRDRTPDAGCRIISHFTFSTSRTEIRPPKRLRLRRPDVFAVAAGGTVGLLLGPTGILAVSLRPPPP